MSGPYNFRIIDPASPNQWLEEAIIEEKFKQSWKGFAIGAVIVLLVVLLIFNFVIGVSKISGDSMKPNFCDKDRVVFFRLAVKIEKGDIIIFKTKSGEKLMKRVVATEGDTVDISKIQGGLYINGEAATEDYIYVKTAVTEDSVEFPVTVGEDRFFVLGDNRVNSKDSRTKAIGLVDKKDIVGRVILDMKCI